jgi:dolichol-phosphate mannosyltransferase
MTPVPVATDWDTSYFPQSRHRAAGSGLPFFFSMRVNMETQRGKTLAFLPTYNERSTIEAMLDSILALPVALDVLVVDDNSADGTGAVIAARASVEPRIHLISRPGRLGIGSAHRLGWLYARRLGYARIVTLDADHSHDPQDIPRFLQALEAGDDVALASRFVPGGKLDYEGWRRILSQTANRLAHLLLGLPIAEYTTAFRAARLDRVPPGLIEMIPNDGYSFFVTATVRLARAGLRVREIPIRFYDRRAGRSKMPRLEILRGGFNLARLIVDRRRFDPIELPEGATAQCRHCGEPYVIATGAGQGRCLRCMSPSAAA